VNEGAGSTASDVVLVVTFNVPLNVLAGYELVEGSEPYREWCIPAEVL
jgi:hypothetical protein